MVGHAQEALSLSAESLERVADLDFDGLNSREPLPHQSVYGFTQDSRGYLWIATYGGLSRFDGISVHTYTHDSAISGSLPNNNVRVIVPGLNGDLWIGTDNAGVSIYRAAKDSFEPLPHLPPSLANTRIYSMVSDGHDGIWAGGQFGLFHYDVKTGSYEVFQAAANQPNPSGFALKRVFSVFVDRQGNVWVGGDAGLQVKRAGTTNFESISGLEGEGQVGLHPFVWSFMEDHAGEIWVGCDHVGLATFDPVAHVLRGVPGLAGAKSHIGEHTVRGLLEHAPGEIWIATYGAGLITYDTKDGFIRSFAKGSGRPYPIKNNFLRDIFKDRSGVVWLATDNGVSKLNDSTTGIYQIHPSLLHRDQQSGTEVRSIGKINGEVWVGFDQGEFGPLGKDAEVQKIALAKDVPPGLSTGREILVIKGDGRDKVYAAGTGLFRIDLKTRTYRPIRDPLIEQEVISSLSLDGDGVWAGTYNGLYRYNSRTGQSRMYAHDPSDPNSLSENDIRRLLRSEDGRLWLSTRSGLALRDPVTGHFRAFRHIPKNADSLPSNNLWAMTEDQSGRLWIGTTDAGLAVLYKWASDGTPLFRTLDVHSGLPSNSVLTMAVGKDGRIWANTASGLAVIDPKTMAIQVFAKGEGLRSASEKLFGSVSLEDGTLLFRGADGLIAVQPDHLDHRAYRAPLVMTTLQLHHDSGSPIVAAYDAASSDISLHADHRGFDANFALLDYTSPESTRYSTMLVGVDKDWVPLAEGDSAVSYSDLPAGDYQLRIRAVSGSGQVSALESAFRIHAPKSWNETLPFRLLLALLSIGLIYAFVRVRTAVLERRRQQLEIEIADRILEVSDQRRKLEIANELLSQLAIRDPLTDLYNRRHFLEILESELRRSQRSAQTFSLLLVDIDHFKVVNDSHGHLAGDAVIQAVAARIAKALRGTDTLARFGGEEYIVLLPNTSESQATVLAHRILSAVSSTPVEIGPLGLDITVSVGSAEAEKRDTSPLLLERTDKALYAAKSAGRNCLRTTVRPPSEEAVAHA